MTIKLLHLWMGEFGDEYTERNEIIEKNIAHRVFMWGAIGSLLSVSPKSILEIGAGTGINLIAIDRIYEMHDQEVDLFALEPNKKASDILISQSIRNLSMVSGYATNIVSIDGSVDLAFTSGVLIHIHPDDVLKAMKEIHRVSRKYIVCVEYFAPEVREIKYRGQDGALWLNDYGSLWLNNFKLTCLGYGFFWKRLSGLDNLTYWVFEKVN